MDKAKSLINKKSKVLEKLIVNKYGHFDESLREQLAATAINGIMIEKMAKELIEGRLTMIVSGSTGQNKNEANPLLPQYNNAQRVYTQQLAALGLNKLSEKKADAVPAKNIQDPTATYFETINN